MAKKSDIETRNAELIRLYRDIEAAEKTVKEFKPILRDLAFAAVVDDGKDVTPLKRELIIDGDDDALSLSFTAKRTTNIDREAMFKLLGKKAFNFCNAQFVFDEQAWRRVKTELSVDVVTTLEASGVINKIFVPSESLIDRGFINEKITATQLKAFVNVETNYAFSAKYKTEKGKTK